MSSPTPKVEIAFTNDPLTLAPTWVDVSAYVRRSPAVTIRRGRQSELDQFDAGYCQLTLSNRDRRFDPSYAAGPYFGNLIPRKRIRVTAVWSSVDYVMFTGWVTGWPQGLLSPAGKDATVTIEAIDPIAWLANNNLPTDLVYSYAATTIGSLALFLRGADTTRWNDATSNGYSATVGTGRGATSSSLAAGSISPSVGFNAATIWILQRHTTTGAWSISLWFQTSNTAASVNLLGGGTGSGVAGGGPFSQLSVGSSGEVAFSWGNNTTGNTVDTAPFSVNDGVPHHLVITGDDATITNTRIYVDGVDRSANWSPPGAATLPVVIDSLGASSSGDNTFLFGGSLQDVAVFSKQLSAAEVAAFYQRSYGYLEETSAVRVTRLLDDVGWPATWRDITTTSRATVGELVYNAAPVLSKLQEIQRTEQGRIFASKAGNVTFLERYYVQEATAGKTVQQIFSDDGGATALPFSTFGFQFNDIDVTNAATVTTPTTWASASDATSITANGLQSKKVDTILSTFDAANAMASGLVAQGKTATYRAAPILVYPEKNTTRWDEVLLLELAHRVSMEITPMAVGSQNVQEVTVEQIEWNIENTLWSFTVTGSPTGSPSGVGGDVFFVLNESVLNGPDLLGY